MSLYIKRKIVFESRWLTTQRFYYSLPRLFSLSAAVSIFISAQSQLFALLLLIHVSLICVIFSVSVNIFRTFCHRRLPFYAQYKTLLSLSSVSSCTIFAHGSTHFIDHRLVVRVKWRLMDALFITLHYTQNRLPPKVTKRNNLNIPRTNQKC